KDLDNLIKEGVAKFGEVHSSGGIAQHLFEDKQVPDLSFLETHVSQNSLADQTFSSENRPSSEPQPEQQQQELQPEPDQ
ncbi:hypothetical protein A2U01_0051698, partial [Trifolium medium]|nr:hypothetical protein [Trifolium medium]